MLKEEISKRASIIEDGIEKYLVIEEPEELFKAARHLIDAGGKRLRPVLSLISAEALGEDWRRILPAALAIELIHNFTLIHDDIMDDDALRRNVPTVHIKWDVPTAILAGDTLFAKAYDILMECNVEPKYLVKASKVIADVCVKICQGQHLDMSFERSNHISEKNYIDMVQKKTAVLIAASCALPAILFGKDEKIVNTLWNFGLLSGTAFQIHDDVLDIIGGEKIGKDWCSDIVEGKKTIIILNAIEKGVDISIFGTGSAGATEKKNAVEQLVQCGAVDYARSMAENFLKEAIDNLHVLEDSYARDLLEEIADYLIKREY